MRFHFAWETKMGENAFHNKMRSALDGVKYLVIIGYSFPVFNRSFDKDIFKSLWNSGLKKVYYQVRQPDPVALEATFELRNVNIVPIDVVETDSPFVLPFEF